MKTLNKSQYEAIAGAIKHCTFEQMSTMYGGRVSKAHIILPTQLADELADKFSEQDSKFDRNKFLEACGVEPKVEYNWIDGKRKIY